MHDIKSIMAKIKESGDEVMLDKLSDLFNDLIDHSDDPTKYSMDLHILEHGYHFNEALYVKAMEGKDPKWTPETVESLISSHGIKLDDYKCLTKYDLAYVMNSLYKMYYPLIADSGTAAKFTEKYIKCHYPIKGGRAFAEWMTKCKLTKMHEA